MHIEVAAVVVAYVDTSGHFFVEASDYVVSFWFGYVVFRDARTRWVGLGKDDLSRFH